VEGPVGDGASFLFSARRSYLDFIFKAAGFGFVPEYWDFLGKASWELDRKNSLTIFGIGVLDNVRFFNDTEDKKYDNSRILGSDQKQYFTGISLKHLIRNGFFTVSLGRTYVDYSYLQSDSLLNPVFSSDSEEDETGLSADGVLLLDRMMDLSFGIQDALPRKSQYSGTKPNPAAFNIST